MQALEVDRLVVYYEGPCRYRYMILMRLEF